MPRQRLLTLALALMGLSVAASVCSALQTSPDPSDGFVGTWQGKFQGTVFVTLTLTKQDGKLTGSITHTTIQVDQAGNLTSAIPKAGSDPITEATFANDQLHLTSKSEDGQDINQYEMKLQSAGQAELQMVNTPAGVTAPKAWSLERLSSAAAQAEAAPSMKSKLSAAARIWMQGQFGANTQATSAGTTGIASNATNTTTASAPAPATPALQVSNAPLDAGLRKDLDSLPRRVRDQFKNPGDMVNIVIIGSEEQMKSSLDAATWHIADTDNRQAVVNAILQTYQKKDYLQMPMSKLYLFDRIQDFGFEEAEPIAMVASRNHFRLWKAPFTWNGQTVWAGAGTHDIGFEKDVRNGSVTHKIDPAIDGERDNIGATLQKAGKVKSMSYYLPPDPVQDSKNATGGGFHSDGRVLVIFLN